MSNKSKNYFEYSGNRYYEGTIVEFDNTGYPQAKYGEYTGTADLFTIMKSPTERFANDTRLLFMNNEHNIVRIVNAVDSYSKVEKIKVYKDTDCNDMFYAWIAYIVAMIFATILYDRLIAWLLITVIFYFYRKSKLYVSKRSYESKKRNGGV